MRLSEMIKNAIDKKGYKNLKDASRALGLSPEILRVIISKGHIPKDSTLALIAKKLDIPMPVLVLAAHQEKVPAEAKAFFLTPAPAGSSRSKRKYPLSEEQTSYLEQILTIDEIMLLRKFRQVNDKARTQIGGFVDFIYASKRES